MVRDWRTAGLSEVDAALCAYAEKLTRDQHAVGREDIDVLRSHGLDDVAIHDATQVIAYFNYITRVADGLGVEPDTFIPRWGGDASSPARPLTPPRSAGPP